MLASASWAMTAARARRCSRILVGLAQVRGRLRDQLLQLARNDPEADARLARPRRFQRGVDPHHREVLGDLVDGAVDLLGLGHLGCQLVDLRAHRLDALHRRLEAALDVAQLLAALRGVVADLLGRLARPLRRRGRLAHHVRDPVGGGAHLARGGGLGARGGGEGFGHGADAGDGLVEHRLHPGDGLQHLGFVGPGLDVLPEELPR
ncbi:MAG: hypothetical protein QM765_48730 [Myxococcales bacterium]